MLNILVDIIDRNILFSSFLTNRTKETKVLIRNYTEMGCVKNGWTSVLRP